MTEPSKKGRAAPNSGLAKVEESRRLQSLWVTSARMLSAVLAMAIPIVLTRVLDQSTFGSYKLLFLIAMTAVSLLTLGIPGSLYYFVPRSPDDSQGYQVQSAVTLAFLGAIGGVLVFLLAPMLADVFDASILPYMGWIALFIALSVPATLIPVAPMVDRRAVLASSLLGSLDFLRAALIVGVALVTRDLYAIVIAASVVVVFKLVSVVYYLIWRGRTHPLKGGIQRRLLRQQLAYALPFAGIAVIGLFRNQLHAFFVAANFSQAEFAVYAVATLKIPLIGQFTQTVGEVVVIENSKSYAARRIEEMRHVWRRATYSLSLVLFPIFAIGVVFATDIMVVLFGGQYAAAGSLFRVYMFLVPLSILIASPMLRATGDLKVMLVADIIALVVTVVSLLLLVGKLGPTGAVLSLILGRATFIALASRRTAERLELGIGDFLPWVRLLLLFVIAVGAALVSSAISQSFPPFARLLVGGGLASAVFAGVALGAGLVPHPERELIGQMFRRLRGR